MQIKNYRAALDCKTQSIRVFAQVRNLMESVYQTSEHLSSADQKAYAKLLSCTKRYEEVELPFAMLSYFNYASEQYQKLECSANFHHVLDVLADHYQKQGFLESILQFFKNLKEEQV